jgi:hypothetical protein
MECNEAQLYVSALYDGETIPPEAVRHIDVCINCRKSLREYAALGAEMRLLGQLADKSPVPKEAPFKTRKFRRSFLGETTRVPRFAFIAAGLILLALIPAGWTLLRAQDRPLWFQFQLQPFPLTDNASANVGQAGLKTEMSWLFGTEPDGMARNAGARIEIKAVRETGVDLEIAGRMFGIANSTPVNTHTELAKVPVRRVSYVPGKTLKIPIAGNGVLYLSGSVVDHQPKIAWGHSLEPNPGELILSSPVLFESNHVVADSPGATTIVRSDREVAQFYSPDEGLFQIGLRPFAAAVKGEAEWGRLTFKLYDKRYTLVAGSPICGGDQPHTVWVAHDAAFVPPPGLGQRSFLGSAKLDQP